MLNALNYLLKVRANGNSGAKEAFNYEFFFLSKRKMALEVVTFSWLFYSIFRWGLHSERNVMTGIISVKIHFHLPPLSKF